MIITYVNICNVGNDYTVYSNSPYIQLSIRLGKIKMSTSKSYLAFSLLVVAVYARSLPQNETTSIVTTYAKVANFGRKVPTVNEGRSSGMSLYTQR